MKALPQQLIDSLKNLPGFDEQKFSAAHKEEHKITSIRLNPFKPKDPEFTLDAPVKWCSSAYYLTERPSFTHDPLFHAGCYYVQEAGSMFLEHALQHTVDLSQNLKVLDLCASPGGKSTLINSLLTKESLLVANEVVKSRADILAMNLSKWGTANTVVTNNDPQKFAATEYYFDVIVVDAPCSGSGLFRKQPEAINEWSLDNVNLCSARQKRILADILPALKEDGTLIYSTCSYSFEEDEAIVQWLIKEFDLEYVPIPIQTDWGIVETPFGYRFYPHLTKSEGFFIAVLQKKGESLSERPSKIKGLNLTKAEETVLKEFLDIECSIFYKNSNQFHLVNQAALDFISTFTKNFYFKKAGVTIGEIKGKDLVPAQEFAWSVELNTKNRVDLDKTNALKYLKKQLFETSHFETGFSLICFQNQALGWAKILPNRINNYLPNEFRILN